MAKSTRLVVSFAVAAALAVPAFAFAQATQRGGSSSSGSSGSSGGQAVPRGGGSTSSGGSSSGGSSSGGSSSGSSSSGSAGPSGAAPIVVPSVPQTPRGESRRAPTTSGTKTGSTATSRTGSSGSSGTASGGSAASSRPAGGGTSGSTAGGSANLRTGRDRNGRPVVSTAIARPLQRGTVFPIPIYGFGWNFGFGYWGFDPFYYGYGSSAWLWGRSGFWYNPYGYYGYYDPYAYSGGSYSGGSSEPSARRTMGSLRLKASPSVAKVYVDGTLMGTVDDFDGLTHHLELEAGAHRIELKADGYQTLSKDVVVLTGTTTLRLSLKKK